MALQLRSWRVHPKRTHIAYFSKQAPLHLRFAERGIVTQMEKNQISKAEGEKKLKQLKELAMQAKIAIQERQVTYEWWLKWNAQLGIVLTDFSLKNQFMSHSPEDQREHLQVLQPQIAELVWLFPFEIALPIPAGHSLGIIPITRAIVQGIHFLELSPHRINIADGGANYSSYGKYLHDTTHVLMAYAHKRARGDNPEQLIDIWKKWILYLTMKEEWLTWFISLLYGKEPALRNLAEKPYWKDSIMKVDGWID